MRRCLGVGWDGGVSRLHRIIIQTPFEAEPGSINQSFDGRSIAGRHWTLSFDHYTTSIPFNYPHMYVPGVRYMRCVCPIPPWCPASPPWRWWWLWPLTATARPASSRAHAASRRPMVALVCEGADAALAAMGGVKGPRVPTGRSDLGSACPSVRPACLLCVVVGLG